MKPLGKALHQTVQGKAKQRALAQALKAKDKALEEGNWKMAVSTLDEQRFLVPPSAARRAVPHRIGSALPERMEAMRP